MNNEDWKATQYGELVYTTITGITNVIRIRLYDNCVDNWCDQLIHNGKLYYRTDQHVRLSKYDKTYKGFSESELTTYDSVYFNGVLLYKRSIFRKIIDHIKG